MKGQIFRFAHLGCFDYMDTIAIIGALEQVAVSTLKLPGFEFGKALAAAQRVFAERDRARRSRSWPKPFLRARVQRPLSHWRPLNF